MRTKLFITTCLLFVPLSLIACNLSPGSDEPSPAELDATVSSCLETQLAPGAYTREITHNGLQRTYTLQVPSSIDTSSPAPLMLALHGGGSSAETIVSVSEVSALAEAEGFLVVAPDGAPTPFGQQVWNAGACCGNTGADDVGFIRAAVAATSEEACVDQSRIYAFGHSNGAMLAHRLACEASDLIAAIGANAGYLVDQNLETNPPTQVFECAPDRPVPVLSLHGLQDECAPFEGGPSAVNGDIRPAVTDVVADWGTRNGCTGALTEQSSANGVTCSAIDGCPIGGEVELCTSELGGHAWPGATVYPNQAQCGGAAMPDFDGIRVIWDFVSARSMP